VLTYCNIHDYIVNSVDEFLISAPNYNLILCGDFNDFYIRNYLERLCTDLNVVNLVNVPTRKDAILDLCLVSVDIVKLYQNVTVGASIGNTDHNTIFVKPVATTTEISVLCKVYDFRESNISSFLNVLAFIDYSDMYKLDSINDKAQFLNDSLIKASSVIPFREVIMTNKDKSWMTPKIKYLINDRWYAFRSRNWPVYMHLKDKIKREIVHAKKAWAKKASDNVKQLWSVINETTGRNNLHLYEDLI
jgi:hypothetical protein